MGETSAPKQSHERCLERLHSLKEISQGPFSADGIAYQQSEKINGFVGAEASSYQADLIRKGWKRDLRSQDDGPG
jgi:hypothetical protein